MHKCVHTHTCAPENKTGKITERFSDYRSIVLKDNLVLESKTNLQVLQAKDTDKKVINCAWGTWP